MSTATLTPPAARASAGPRGNVTMPRTVRSEWIKFRTLPSSWYTLAAAVAALVISGLAIGYHVGQSWATVGPDNHLLSQTMGGYNLAQLLIGVLGILFVTGEYGTGMIRSTFAAVPKRVPVLAAKTTVFGAVALVSMMVAAFATYLGSQAFLSHYGHGTSLSATGALRTVVGTALYLTLVGLLGGAIGWIIRNTAGAISTLVGLLLVAPVIFGALGRWSDSISQFLPSKAGGSYIASVHTSGTLQPVAGLAVLALWVVGAFAVAAIVVRRRDA